jgi:hypothetical protein
MSQTEACPRCHAQELYVSELVPASGYRGPDLLPGLGMWFASAQMRVVACQACGLMQFFADAAARKTLAGGENGWRRL